MPGIESTSSALAAEKLRLNLIAQNIANAQTTKDVNGQAYKRKYAVFEAYMTPEQAAPGIDTQGVRVSGVKEDMTPGLKIFNPQHPHADKNGMVEYPNVQLSNEMVDMIMASRAYEANLNVVKTSYQMAQQALNLGK